MKKPFFHQYTTTDNISRLSKYLGVVVLFLWPFLHQDLWAQNAFITTWKTDNPGTSNSTSITIPTHNGGYLYDVDWNNDGTFDEFGLTGPVTHDFGTAGTYTIRIRGAFPHIYFNNGGDKDKILSVDQWGDIAWLGMEYAFYGCSNLHILAADSPDLSSVISMKSMFEHATSFNENISDWDVSNVTDMSFLFRGATSFNQSIGNWNVGNVVNMANMFTDAIVFNQPIGGWDVSQVNNMENMFWGAFSFNQALNNWEVGNVTKMKRMFAYAKDFNQDISNWDVSKVTTMEGMFTAAKNFNQPIGNWVVDKVENMADMFAAADVFNQPIGGWDVSMVMFMSNMFWGAMAFDQDISNWDVSNVTNMNLMFSSINGLSEANYDALLLVWSTLSLQSGVPFGAGTSKYTCAAEAARETLTDPLGFNWIITDGGINQSSQGQYYYDGDGDGYGTGNPILSCDAPGPDYVLHFGDCNDSDPNVNPNPNCAGTIRIWTGYINNDWDEACNWSPNCVPSVTDIVFIFDTANDPIIGSSTAAFARLVELHANSSLNINSGGSLTVDLASGSGTALYANGNLINDGTLNIVNAGDDALQIDANGQLTNSGLFEIGQSGTIGIHGIRLSGTVDNSGIINIDNVGSDAISMLAGSQLTNTGLLQIGQSGSIGLNGINFNGTVNNSGTINIDNTANRALWAFGNFTNTGTLNLGQNGGTGSIKWMAVRQVSGNFYNQPGASLTIDNANRHGLDLLGNFYNQGNIFIGLNGTLGTIGNHWGINVDGATFENSGTVQVQNSQGQSILVSNGGSFTNTGMLEGGGIFNLNSNDLGGTFAPGYSPGTATFIGDQTFTASNTLEIEVNGTTPGIEHDQVIVNGTATISGTLSVSIGYTLTSNDRIVFLTATNISGTFGTISPALPADWTVDYSVSGEVALQFSGVLPVELVYFSVKKEGEKAVLNWQAASETNNAGFEIEHSTDGRKWNAIGFLEGHGNSTEAHSYFFPHKSPSHGTNYYRLRQMDFDGGFEFSNIRSVQFEGDGNEIRVFPNPATTYFNIQFLTEYEQAIIRLFDAEGRLVMEEKTGDRQSLLRMDVGQLVAGLYLLKIQTGNKTFTQKLQIHKD